MTVDSTYKAESPIQVEVSSDQGLFPRESVGSCGTWDFPSLHRTD